MNKKKAKAKQQELPGMPEGKLREVSQRYLLDKQVAREKKDNLAKALKELTDLMSKTKTLRFRTQDPDGGYVVISIKEGKQSVTVSPSKDQGVTD